MRMSLIGVRTFKAKNGKEYTVMSGINSKTGKTLETFLDSQYVDVIARVTPNIATVQEALKALPEVEVDFDERGRLESVRLPEEE